MKLRGRSKDLEKIEVVISNRTVVRVLVMVVLTIIGLGILNKISHALILIFIALFLSLALNAPVHWIAQHLPGKRRGSRSLATSVSFLIVVVVLAGFIALVVPPAIRQVASFVKAVPNFVEDLQDQDSAIGKFIRDNNLEDATDSLSDDLSSVIKNSGDTAVTTVSTVGGAIVSTLTVLVLTFMMLVEGPRWVNYGKRFLAQDKHDRVTQVIGDMYKVIRGYVNGQVTLAFIAAIMLLPPMLILHVPYAGALAAIVFICGLFPMIGHYVGATLVTLVALIESPVSAVLILAYYVLYQQIENYVVQPRVQANATNMSPLIVFASVIIGINLGGILGGIVAIPVAGCIRVLVIDYLQNRGKIPAREAKALKADTK
jgi:predicted PurR-regulated permease PerM